MCQAMEKYYTTLVIIIVYLQVCVKSVQNGFLMVWRENMHAQNVETIGLFYITTRQTT